VHKQTQYTNITKAVRMTVWERDDGECILCKAFGRPEFFSRPNPEAHFIPRSKGGLGVEENILTLCRAHHRELDEGPKRQYYREYLRRYLQSCYPDWDEEKLIYRKDMF